MLVYLRDGKSQREACKHGIAAALRGEKIKTVAENVGESAFLLQVAGR